MNYELLTTREKLDLALNQLRANENQHYTLSLTNDLQNSPHIEERVVALQKAVKNLRDEVEAEERKDSQDDAN